jgi:hypothetical protein
MNSFYKLLVKESLDREDVDAMEKENIKDCHEIVQVRKGSSINGVRQRTIFDRPPLNVALFSKKVIALSSQSP